MRSRRALANRIVDSVVLIHSNVYKANNTYVTNKDDAEYRLGLQEEAIKECHIPCYASSISLL